MKLYSEAVSHPSFLYLTAKNEGLLTDSIDESDYLLLPFPYEYIFDYQMHELESRKISLQDVCLLKEIALRFDNASVALGKPLVVTYYRDPATHLHLGNALVFRTSAFRSAVGTNEFGLPAFLEELTADPGFHPALKPIKPSVSFRGQMAPLSLPFGIALRQVLNKFFSFFSNKFRVANWYNEGYLLRRMAVSSVLKAGNAITADLAINPEKNASAYNEDYIRSFRENDYFICASGHGNYSFRLYEVMRAGRIPVFIDTDCLLPCDDVIDWKSLFIWINKNEANNAGSRIIEFHQTISPEDFLVRQQLIRKTWENYLSAEGFAKYLFYSFLPKYVAKNEVS